MIRKGKCWSLGEIKSNNLINAQDKMYILMGMDYEYNFHNISAHLDEDSAKKHMKTYQKSLIGMINNYISYEIVEMEVKK